MKHTKLKTYAVLLLGLGLQATHAKTALIVKQKVEPEISFNLSELKMITFSGGDVMVVKNDGSLSSFVRTNVQYMNFKENIENKMDPINWNEKGKLMLYPNPVKDVLNIEMAKTDLRAVQIEIVSIEGKVLFRSVLNNNISCISVAGLFKGVYMLRINDGVCTEISKFIKQ